MHTAEEFYDKRNLSKNIIKDKAGLPDGAKKVLAAIIKLSPNKFLDMGCGDTFCQKIFLENAR